VGVKDVVGGRTRDGTGSCWPERGGRCGRASERCEPRPCQVLWAGGCGSRGARVAGPGSGRTAAGPRSGGGRVAGRAVGRGRVAGRGSGGGRVAGPTDGRGSRVAGPGSSGRPRGPEQAAASAENATRPAQPVCPNRFSLANWPSAQGIAPILSHLDPARHLHPRKGSLRPSDTPRRPRRWTNLGSIPFPADQNLEETNASPTIWSTTQRRPPPRSPRRAARHARGPARGRRASGTAACPRERPVLLRGRPRGPEQAAASAECHPPGPTRVPKQVFPRELAIGQRYRADSEPFGPSAPSPTPERQPSSVGHAPPPTPLGQSGLDTFCG